MKKNILFIRFFIAMMLLAAIAFSGCEKQTDETSEDTSLDLIKENETPSLVGTWTGTFNERSTVLEITEQSDSSFSGKISINYRQQIEQEVKGTFSPTTQQMTMEDQLQSRFQGSYKGSLSKTGSNYSGTFTMESDGTTFAFNLTKK